MTLSLTADLCEKSSLDTQPKSDGKPKKLQLCAVTLQVHFLAVLAHFVKIFLCVLTI